MNRSLAYFLVKPTKISSDFRELVRPWILAFSRFGVESEVKRRVLVVLATKTSTLNNAA
jgi:hypothetical protein